MTESCIWSHSIHLLIQCKTGLLLGAGDKEVSKTRLLFTSSLQSSQEISLTGNLRPRSMLYAFFLIQIVIPDDRQITITLLFNVF